MQQTAFAKATSRAALAAAIAMAGCASGPHVGPDDAVVKQAELDALRATAAQVAALEQRVTALEADKARIESERAALEERLLVMDQRAGRLPFRTEELTPLDIAARFVDVERVEAPGAPAHKVSLAREARGHGLVVAYWATWCKPCIADDELALLRGMRKELGDHGVAFVTMAIDGLDKVRAHPRTASFLYPLWQRDDAHFEMLPESFVRERGVDMPLFLVVSASGRIRWYRTGKLSPAAVRDMVTAAVLASRG